MNILIFGDSITWGAYDPEQGGWVNRLRNYFEAQDNDINVYNLGICGDTTTGILDRFEVEAKSRKPDLILFGVGINDAILSKSSNSQRTSIDEFEQNLVKLLEKARKYTDKIVFVGLTTVDETKTNPVCWDEDIFLKNENITQLDKIIEQFCTKNKLLFIPTANLISTLDLTDDGLHPNSVGHEKLFEHIKPVIESVL